MMTNATTLNPSDDKLPMTGVWYRSTIETWCMGKVLEVGPVWVEGVMTGGQLFRCTINEFADSWELI